MKTSRLEARQGPCLRVGWGSWLTGGSPASEDYRGNRRETSALKVQMFITKAEMFKYQNVQMLKYPMSSQWILEFSEIRGVSISTEHSPAFAPTAWKRKRGIIQWQQNVEREFFKAANQRGGLKPCQQLLSWAATLPFLPDLPLFSALLAGWTIRLQLFERGANI